MMLPENIRPMLAVGAEPFDSADYQFEIKWDGLRALAFLTGATRLQSRNLREITAQYPELAALHRQTRRPATVLDGEIITLKEGKPSFQQLQSRMHAVSPQAVRRAARENPVIYIAFDLLYYNGRSLLREPWQTRRELLQANIIPGPHLLISDAVPEKGRAFFREVVAKGLEGIMAKEKNSPYLPGKRSPWWKKIRATKSGHFVICGYTVNPAGRQGFSALVLGAFRDGRLLPCGLVGTGFSEEEINRLLRLFKPLVAEESPFSPSGPAVPGVRWLRPEIVCEVEYLQFTAAGQLRHPLYRGLRPEVQPTMCRVPDN